MRAIEELLARKKPNRRAAPPSGRKKRRPSAIRAAARDARRASGLLRSQLIGVRAQPRELELWKIAAAGRPLSAWLRHVANVEALAGDARAAMRRSVLPNTSGDTSDESDE